MDRKRQLRSIWDEKDQAAAENSLSVSALTSVLVASDGDDLNLQLP